MSRRRASHRPPSRCALGALDALARHVLAEEDDIGFEQSAARVRNPARGMPRNRALRDRRRRRAHRVRRARAKPDSAFRARAGMLRAECAARNARQRTLSSRPCRSITLRLPAAWCSPSTFCVSNASTRPSVSSAASARVRAVRPRAAEATPADQAARPVTRTRRRIADERLQRDRRPPLPAAVESR